MQTEMQIELQASCELNVNVNVHKCIVVLHTEEPPCMETFIEGNITLLPFYILFVYSVVFILSCMSIPVHTSLKAKQKRSQIGYI